MTQAISPDIGSDRLAVCCFNVKYSPNLGDGLLSECLEDALIAHGASPATTSVDLAGRIAYGQGMAGRGTIMATLDALPDGLRHYAVRAPLAVQSRRKWGPHYENGLRKMHAVSIGGGNLLSDHDLNFPTKLALALRHARSSGLPVAIYACGMAQSWSAEGDRRLRKELESGVLRAVFLRDEASKRRWDARFAQVSGCEATVVRDPGLLAARTYAPAARAEGGQPVIGLGLMSHVAIRYHADTRLSKADLARWYIELARTLRQSGARVCAFTNGSPEDRAAASELKPELVALGVETDTLEPATPADLAATVAGCQAIVAYRMHALIAAYAFGVPGLALSWDDKVDAFMASVGRSDWLGDPQILPAAEAAERLLLAARTGVEPDTHARVIQEAFDDVGRLYAALRAAAGRT